MSSPRVAMVFVLIVTSGCAFRIAFSTRRVCARASSLPRVPRVMLAIIARIYARYFAGEAVSFPKAAMRGADFRRARYARLRARDDSILVRLNQQTQRHDRQ